MLVVRFKETFRERMPEWVLSAGMLAWGLLTLASTDLFITRPFYHPLLLLMDQTHWGLLAVITGIIRLVFLVINGGWRPSAHIRMVGCSMGAMLWSGLFISSLSLEWVSTGAATYAMLLVLDTISLWFAAGDAKLADLTARSKLNRK